MTAGSARTPARAETVGSLLRPPELRAAVDAFYEEGHSAVLREERSKDRRELRAVEDEAIRDAVRRQIDAGLDVVTDGEYRRWMFLNSFYDAVEGFRTDNVVHFRNASGEDVPLAVHEIVDRLRPVDSPASREAAFLAETTGGHPFKVTFPAASIFTHPFTYKVGVTDRGYASLEEFVAHAVEIERGLVADAIGAGARYVQFDFPLYPYLVDPKWVARFEEWGLRVPHLVDAAVQSRKQAVDYLSIAENLFKQGRTREAAELLKKVAPHEQYLTEAERSRLTQLRRNSPTTSSWSSGTTWVGTAGSVRSGSSGRMR